MPYLGMGFLRNSITYSIESMSRTRSRSGAVDAFDTAMMMIVHEGKDSPRLLVSTQSLFVKGKLSSLRLSIVRWTRGTMAGAPKTKKGNCKTKVSVRCLVFIKFLYL